MDHKVDICLKMKVIYHLKSTVLQHLNRKCILKSNSKLTIILDSEQLQLCVVKHAFHMMYLKHIVNKTNYYNCMGTQVRKKPRICVEHGKTSVT